ncbi:MAG: TonB-dependent receptor, partial [Porticoccaceae bacterium]|nr:TonB-dependent receptor [Porticoccaceae bacterium]
QAFYVEDLWQATERLQIIPGIRYTRDEYLKQNFVEPRLKLNYEVSPSLSLNSALGRYHQQPHPSEIIPVFGNPRLRSPTSDHIVLGFDKALSNSWSVSVDTYYKRFDNLVTGAPGNSNLNFINGADGSAYGLELMVNKERTDRWYGWLSVSASKTERTIKSTGVTSPYFTDAPLVVNLVGNYQLTPIWNIGVRWTYRSGLPYTPITGNRPNPDFPGRFLPVFGALNSLRADAYHRLDIRAERPFSTSWASGTFFIDMINAYNRKNFRSLEYEPVGLTGSNFRLVREPGLELFPSIGVKLEF